MPRMLMANGFLQAASKLVDSFPLLGSTISRRTHTDRRGQIQNELHLLVKICFSMCFFNLINDASLVLLPIWNSNTPIPSPHTLVTFLSSLFFVLFLLWRMSILRLMISLLNMEWVITRSKERKKVIIPKVNSAQVKTPTGLDLTL